MENKYMEYSTDAMYRAHITDNLNILDLRDHDFKVCLCREMAPIYTLGNKHNGYLSAKNLFVVTLDKNVYLDMTEKYSNEQDPIEDIDLIYLSGYILCKNIKIAFCEKDNTLFVSSDKIIIFNNQ